MGPTNCSPRSLLVRPCFADPAAWQPALAACPAQNEDGLSAEMEFVDHRSWEDAHWKDVRRAALETNYDEGVFRDFD